MRRVRFCEPVVNVDKEGRPRARTGDGSKGRGCSQTGSKSQGGHNPMIDHLNTYDEDPNVITHALFRTEVQADTV